MLSGGVFWSLDPSYAFTPARLIILLLCYQIITSIIYFDQKKSRLWVSSLQTNRRLSFLLLLGALLYWFQASSNLPSPWLASIDEILALHYISRLSTTSH